MSLVVVALLALAVGTDDPKATVEVDHAKREVVITAGPFHVASMPPGMKHDDMAKDDKMKDDKMMKHDAMGMKAMKVSSMKMMSEQCDMSKMMSK